MSTYLVAFTISDFANKSSNSFSVWARSDAINSADYALSIGPRILKNLENYFNINFPLPKIDMIAIPDFHAGAMENWGLITYRFDKKKSKNLILNEIMQIKDIYVRIYFQFFFCIN